MWSPKDFQAALRQVLAAERTPSFSIVADGTYQVRSVGQVRPDRELEVLSNIPTRAIAERECDYLRRGRRK